MASHSERDLDVTDLRYHAGVVRRRWRILALAVLLGAAAGAVAHQYQRVSYTSEARVLVEPSRTSNSATVMEPEEVATQADVVTSNTVARRVIEEVGLDQDVDRVLEDVRATPVGDTRVVLVTATRPRAQEAADIANSFATEYLAYQAGVNARLKFTAPPGYVLRSGLVPSHPDQRGLVPMSVLGALLGLIFGLPIAYARDRLDDIAREPTRLQADVGDVPILGRLPVDSGEGEHGLVARDDPGSVAGEAYRGLNLSVRFVSAAKATLPAHRERGADIVVIAPTSGRERRVPVAANVAVTAARAGMKVILVDANLRDPSLAARFGIDEEAQGLSHVLAGQAEVGDCLQESGVPDCQVLVAGTRPPNPSELLAAPHARPVWDELAHSAELVIIDCAPVLGLADTLEVVPIAQAVVITTQQRRTHTGDLVAVQERLRRVGQSIDGLVWSS